MKRVDRHNLNYFFDEANYTAASSEGFERGAFDVNEEALLPADARGGQKKMDRDLQRAMVRIISANETMLSRIGGQIDLAQAIRSDTETLVSLTNRARQGATTLVSVADELATSSEHVGQQVDETEQLTKQASRLAENAGSSVEQLRQAASEIGGVVRLIAAVARQTNLLALNATIEAARAGAAGRGFSIVANEVKALSVQTQKATDEIAVKIELLQRSAQGSIDAVGEITRTIGELVPIFGSFADAVSAEIASSNTIRESANESASFIRTVFELADDILARAENSHKAGAEVAAAARGMSGEIQAMQDRLVAVAHQARAADRLLVEIPGSLSCHGQKTPIATVDISLDGALVGAKQVLELADGTRVTLTLESIGNLEARIVTTSDLGLHLAFLPQEGDAKHRLAAFINDVRKENRPLIRLVQEAARHTGEVFEAALKNEQISMDDLFDTDYQPIPDTNPVQFRTRNLAFLEAVLPAIRSSVAQNHANVVFVCAVDRNGYLPVHDALLSKPQRRDQYEWNVLNCRNRRIFDDNKGLRAARNTAPFLIQFQPHDLGGGRMVMRKEISAPIYVKHQHWGAILCSFKHASEPAL